MAGNESAASRNEERILDSSLESVDAAESFVIETARAMGFEEEALHQLGMAVRESMVNAVAHGNRYNSRKKVRLRVSLAGDRLTVEIADEGNGFDPEALPDPLAEENVLRHSGRGLMMIRAFVDEFEVRRREPKGTEVRLIKYLARNS